MNNQEIEILIKSTIVDVVVEYINFHGEEKTGVIQVNRRIVPSVIMAFNDLYDIGFRINNIEPANGRGDKILIDNNITTSYNYRRSITPNGLGKLSKHSWGLAWDINPLVNPAEPDCGMTFEYNSEHGVLTNKEIDIIKGCGFQWGGEIFKGFNDSHHFEVPYTEDELLIQNRYTI